jgi:hypothetical protein
MAASLGSAWGFLNYGVNGQTVTQMAADAATQIDAQRYSRPANILGAWGGVNDIIAGKSAAALYAEYAAYCEARQAAGWEVLAFTQHSWRYLGVDRDAVIAAFNALVIANWTTFADGLVDLSAEPNIGPPGSYSNLTYYNADGVHLTAAGDALVAALVKTAVQQLYP